MTSSPCGTSKPSDQRDRSPGRRSGPGLGSSRRRSPSRPRLPLARHQRGVARTWWSGSAPPNDGPALSNSNSAAVRPRSSPVRQVGQAVEEPSAIIDVLIVQPGAAGSDQEPVNTVPPLRQLQADGELLLADREQPAQLPGRALAGVGEADRQETASELEDVVVPEVEGDLAVEDEISAWYTPWARSPRRSRGSRCTARRRAAG